MDLSSPTTPTDTSGREAINNSGSRGMVVGDGTTDRVLIGFQKDGFGTGGDYGIKVSQDGYDVKSATDTQLVMSSAFNGLKIVSSGTVNLGIQYTGTTVSAGTQSYTLTHNLGYQPVALAYASLPDGASLEQTLIQLPYVTFFQAGVNDGHFMASTYFNITTTTVKFYVVHNAGTDYAPLTPTWTVKYYLMKETSS